MLSQAALPIYCNSPSSFLSFPRFPFSSARISFLNQIYMGFCGPSLSFSLFALKHPLMFSSTTVTAFNLDISKTEALSFSLSLQQKCLNCTHAVRLIHMLECVCVTLPLFKNVRRSSISWSILMPWGTAQNHTIHIVSSQLQSLCVCVCVQYSTYVSFGVCLGVDTPLLDCSCVYKDK